MTVTTLIVPGLHSSGPAHWQSWLEQQIPDSVRVIQRDWAHADLPEWSSRIRREIVRQPGRILIVAHSFGVLAAAQAADDHRERIAGAMFVAPADPAKFGVQDFLPRHPLGFPAVIVASTDDPWMSFERAARLAGEWHAQLVNLGDAGHINTEAGYGPWPEALLLLDRIRGAHSLTDRSYAREQESIRDAPRVRARAPQRLHGAGQLGILEKHFQN